MIFTKETLIKALRTFVQAALAYVAVNITLIDFSDDKEVVKTALIGLGTSALASGIAAAMNLQKVQKPNKEIESEGEADIEL